MSLMHKIESTDEKSPGNFNENEVNGGLPIGWREITEKQFAESMFFMYTPRYVEFRQAVVDKGKCIEGVHIYWFHDNTGIAFVNDFWGGKVRYFACGCDHHYEERGSEWCRQHDITHFGYCYHVSECTKCGMVDAHDSSD